MTRFGYDSTVPLPDFGFIFAVPLIAKCPSQEALFANVVGSRSEQGWLELVNTSDFTTSYSVKMYTVRSGLVLDTAMTIEPFAQVHTDLTVLLPFRSGDHGFVRVEPITSGGKFVAQTAHYIRTSDKLDTMFALQLRKTSSELIKSSFNQFLNMENEIFTANTGNQSIVVDFRNPDSSREPAAGLDPFSSHFASSTLLVPNLELAPNTFGVLTAEPNISEPILSALFRVHISPSTLREDFIIPVPFR